VYSSVPRLHSGVTATFCALKNSGPAANYYVWSPSSLFFVARTGLEPV
jgi:hypothetical protein